MPEELTNTDKKIIYSDHDLLVRLNTTNDIMVRQLGEFIERYERGYEGVIQRITALEINQAAHKQETKDNATDIEALQKKSDRNDFLNAIGTALAAIGAALWGGSR